MVVLRITGRGFTYNRWVSTITFPLAMRFEGSKNYVATDDLRLAVNAAITLQRPLLIKGEPGTGKTVLAEEVAKALGAPLLTWHIKDRKSVV